MKFKKTLAAVSAAAIAVSSMAVSSFAAITNANSGTNYSVKVADLLPKGVDVSSVYGFRVYFSDDSVEAIKGGANGGLVFNLTSGWNQKAWCNGCEVEEHEFQYDEATNTVTRLDAENVVTAEMISGEEGQWAEVVVCQWWGGDITIDKVALVDKDGKDLQPVEDLTAKVNYFRPDGDYESWADLHYWNLGGFTGDAAFTVSGTTATATIDLTTLEGDISFKIRKGGDSWADESAEYTIKTDLYKDGVAEVWCVAGDDTLYTEKPAGFGKTEDDNNSSDDSSSEDTSSEDTSSEDTSSEDTSSEDTSSEDTSSEDTSADTSEDTSSDTSDDTSADTSVDTSDVTSDVTSDDTSSDVKPDVKPGDCTGEVPEYVIKAGSSKEGSVTVGLEAQFDASVGTIGEWPALPTTTMTADGSDVTLTYDFSDYGKVKFGGNYVAIATDLAWEDMEAQPDLYSAANVAIKSIKLDGVEVGDVSKLCVNNEANGGKALRITLLNEWNDNFKGNAPLSGIELPEFSKVEVTFAVTDANANGGEDVPPPTGVTVAVIPAAIAAVGLTAAIVIKKRK